MPLRHVFTTIASSQNTVPVRSRTARHVVVTSISLFQDMILRLIFFALFFAIPLPLSFRCRCCCCYGYFSLFSPLIFVSRFLFFCHCHAFAAMLFAAADTPFCAAARATNTTHFATFAIIRHFTRCRATSPLISSYAVLLSFFFSFTPYAASLFFMSRYIRQRYRRGIFRCRLLRHYFDCFIRYAGAIRRCRFRLRYFRRSSD